MIHGNTHLPAQAWKLTAWFPFHRWRTKFWRGYITGPKLDSYWVWGSWAEKLSSPFYPSSSGLQSRGTVPCKRRAGTLHTCTFPRPSAIRGRVHISVLMGADAVTWNAPPFSPDNSGAEARGQQVTQVQAAKKMSNELSLQAWSLELWKKKPTYWSQETAESSLPQPAYPSRALEAQPCLKSG